jgi:hypothetical protein
MPVPLIYEYSETPSNVRRVDFICASTFNVGSGALAAYLPWYGAETESLLP